jgi:hypothetical protein
MHEIDFLRMFDHSLRFPFRTLRDDVSIPTIFFPAPPDGIYASYVSNVYVGSVLRFAILTEVAKRLLSRKHQSRFVGLACAHSHRFLPLRLIHVRRSAAGLGSP